MPREGACAVARRGDKNQRGGTRPGPQSEAKKNTRRTAFAGGSIKSTHNKQGGARLAQWAREWKTQDAVPIQGRIGVKQGSIYTAPHTCGKEKNRRKKKKPTGETPAADRLTDLRQREKGANLGLSLVQQAPFTAW